MFKRKPQINFQVDEPMKRLYEEARLFGHHVTRYCTAGLLLMVADAQARAQAMARLCEWEAAYGDASVDEIRAFVQDARAALALRAPGSRRGRSARPAKKAARRGRA